VTGLGLDRVREALKRAQRRVRFADYEDLHRHADWRRGGEGAPYSERVLPVAPDPASVSSVLVFKPDEIGDAVYALPAIAELKRHLPHARFSLACRPLTKPIYERSGLFDEIATMDASSRNPLRRPRLPAFATPIDLSVYLRTYPLGFRDFLRVPARARLHPADPRMQSDSVYRARVSLWTEERRHMALQLLEIAGLVTGREYGFEDVVYPAFTWTGEDATALETAGVTGDGPFVVLHPFAKQETRLYPMDYWPRLFDLLDRELDVTWVAVGGPEDGRLPERPNLVQAQGRLSLGQTGYLLTRAAGFVGNLSGPAHWSAALGTPTVTLMSGHSLPVEWAPLGPSFLVRADVPCAPCHQPTCPIYGLACLTELAPERIAGDISSFLASRLSSPLDARARETTP
jgi:ADP-heptose:LPS heptosyltransferase